MNTEARVVVGYDGSPDSLAALAWAARTASHRGEPVVVTTISDPRETPRGTAWPESWWEEQEEAARKVMTDWPDVPVTFERHVGHLVPRLVESAEGGSMLVVGSRGHSLVGEMLRGSVSQGAARHAAMPVIVVRRPRDPESGTIVVGTDGSDSSDRALEFACQLAEESGDKLLLVRAWHPAAVVADRYGYLPSPDADTFDVAEAALTRTAEGLRASHPDVPVESELFQGAPERGLVDASETAALVVVGSRGHSAVAETLLGSVSQAVLRRAHCPVAVLH